MINLLKNNPNEHVYDYDNVAFWHDGIKFKVNSHGWMHLVFQMNSDMNHSDSFSSSKSSRHVFSQFSFIGLLFELYFEASTKKRMERKESKRFCPQCVLPISLLYRQQAISFGEKRRFLHGSFIVLVFRVKGCLPCPLYKSNSSCTP